MSDMTRDFQTTSDGAGPDARRADLWQAGLLAPGTGRADEPTEYVTARGAEWLASASAFPRSVRALWSARPGSPSVLPCGTAFDVIDVPGLFGRGVLDRLWSAGPGCGPVAAHRGRLWLFAAPGTAARLPALLGWEEWGDRVPPMLCHGAGDAVTVPAPIPGATGRTGATGSEPRWLVAPAVRQPWLPDAAVLLWAMVRTARSAGRGPGARAGAEADGCAGPHGWAESWDGPGPGPGAG